MFCRCSGFPGSVLKIFVILSFISGFPVYAGMMLELSDLSGELILASIFKSNEGLLWIGTECISEKKKNAVMLVHDGDIVRKVEVMPPLQSIDFIVENGNGEIFFAGENRIYKVDRNGLLSTFELDSRVTGLVKSSIGPVAGVESGKLFILSDTLEIIASDVANIEPSALACMNDRLLVAGRKGMRLYEIKQRDGIEIPNEVLYETATFMYFDRSERLCCAAVDSAGNIYAGTTRGLVYCVNGNRDRISRKDGDKMETDNITSLAIDRKNVIWIGTDRGLYRLSPGGVLRKVEEYPSHLPVVAMTPDPDDERILVAAERYIFSIKLQ